MGVAVYVVILMLTLSLSYHNPCQVYTLYVFLVRARSVAPLEKPAYIENVSCPQHSCVATRTINAI